MSAPTGCANCGTNPAHGFATLNGERYCHGDDDPRPTCYERIIAFGVPEVDVLVTMPAMRARIDKVLARHPESGDRGENVT